MSTTPYAYSLSADDEGSHVFPTLDAAVAEMKSIGLPSAYHLENDVVTAHYQDGSSSRVSIRDYIQEVEVNVAEVTAYIDALREKARKADEEWYAKMAAEGKSSITVTGSIPIYMLDRDDLIKREILGRKYAWK